MGDKSPKATQKQAAQKQVKNEAVRQQKGKAIAVKKQAANNPKRSK
jgi:hypothetical protein